MKVLIIHNQLWAHYKSIIFDELQAIAHQDSNFELLVVQIAIIEKSRTALGKFDTSKIGYPYLLIHDGVLEEVPLPKKVIGILKAIASFKPDVVNLTGYYDIASWIVLLYCKIKGIKTILSNESTASDHRRKGIKEWIKSVIVRQFDGFFNFGTQSAQYMLQLGATPEQLLVSKNCVDNTTLKDAYQSSLPLREVIQKQLGLAEHNFIFVGRLIAFKNLNRFIQAFQIAQQQVANSNQWGIIILGDGEEKEGLLQYTQEVSCRNVNFLPGVVWNRVPEYLALSDVLVLPSYSEPWGLVVNEAMACGLPVLVSNQCGCAIDLVQDGKNGFTFDPYDLTALSNLLVKFMTGTIDNKAMGKVSEEIIQEYAPSQVAIDMYRGFKKVSKKSK